MTTPTPIQRYYLPLHSIRAGNVPVFNEPVQDAAGDWVRHSDHLAAMAAAVPRWIPVSERMPEEGVEVLGYGKIGPTSQPTINRTALLRNGDWFRVMDECTHWMPLPQPPKETM